MPHAATNVLPSHSVWKHLLPSMPDVFFAVVLLGLFGRVESWQGLLWDADTGWHIRTGEFILQTGAVPTRDLFSFSRAGQPWFAWEWLADVVFGWLYRWHGLEAVAAFAAAAIGLSAVLLLIWLLRRGVGLWIAAAGTLLAVSASSVHHLARPHLFSLLFFTLGLWLLDEDRRRPGRLVWLLVPMSAVWANLHAGFVSWLAVLGLLAAVCGMERNWRDGYRYASLAGLCSAATLLNPYGWRLHQHIVEYLGAASILQNVQEFQSPRIRSEGMLVFAALLLCGVALASRVLARREWFEGSLVLAFGFGALLSARHIPLFALVAAPVITSECAAWWAARAALSPARSPVRLLCQLSQDWGRRCRLSPWAPVLGALALSLPLAEAPVPDFPETRFPVVAVSRNEDRLAPPGTMPRILTSDQWADYLIFRLYPRQRVFFDGRSDFYGPALIADYQTLLECGRDWRRAFARYHFDLALLPLDWPLAEVLQGDADWRVTYRDSVSVLLQRCPRANPAKGKR